MKLWELDVMLANEFATATSIYIKPSTLICSVCNLADEPPLLLEWDDGGDQIADFVHCGARWLLKRVIAEQITAKFQGAAIRSVQYLDHPKLYRPKGRTKKVRVWLPYEGPELVELVFSHRVAPSPLSTMRVKKRCPECGAVSLDGIDACEGIETWRGIVHTPRDPQRGIFITSTQMGQSDFCWVRGTGRRLFTDRVKQYLEAQSLTNTRFLEVGDVIEG
jgi:hypothetical protein